MRLGMLPIIFLVAGCVFNATVVKGQSSEQDTLYFTKNWKPTVKDSAAFYRLPVKKVDGKFEIRDFYISGQKQMEGTSLALDREIWDGEVTWYDAQGSVTQKSTYVKGMLQGPFITYKEGKKYVAQFANNYFISGSRYLKSGTVHQLSIREGDTLTEIIYNKDLNGIRYEQISVGNKGVIQTTYYGTKGELLGTRKRLSNGNYDGVEVRYYYDPLAVNSISSGIEGDYLGDTVYYPNGVAREVYNQEALTKTYFDTLGSQIGKGVYELRNGRLKMVDGDYFTYFSNSRAKLISVISVKRFYANGKLTTEEFYSKKGNLERKVFYEEGDKVLQKSYDAFGNLIHQMIYKNWLPFEGTEIIGDKEVSYKEGRFVEQLEYYPNSKIVFKKKKDSVATFYSQKGKILGTLKLKDNIYETPLQGVQYVIDTDGDISTIQEFQNGYTTRLTTYRKRLVDDTLKKRYKYVEEFEKDSYNRSREMTFYSNGRIQSDITYKEYKKQFGTYYDTNGKETGTYDYDKKEGTRYEFFPDSDKLKEFEKRKNGKQLVFKEYVRGDQGRYGQIKPVLIQDIDVNCCATFYTRQGDTIASALFRDQKVWEGTLYDVKTRELYTISEGVKEGAYKAFDYSHNVIKSGNYITNKRDGIFKEFTSRGQLLSEVMYENDLLDGFARYYDKEGALKSEMEYRMGKAINGTRQVVKSYGSPDYQETYKDGKLIEKTIFDDKGKRVITYENETQSKTSIYFEDTSIKRLEYTLVNGYVDGVVTSYTKEGEVVHTAVLEKGKLISGTLDILPKSQEREVEFIRLYKDSEVFTVTYFDVKGKKLFTATENSNSKYPLRYINRLGIYQSSIYGNMLY